MCLKSAHKAFTFALDPQDHIGEFVHTPSSPMVAFAPVSLDVGRERSAKLDSLILIFLRPVIHDNHMLLGV
jgi:hypothetical protein